MVYRCDGSGASIRYAGEREIVDYNAPISIEDDNIRSKVSVDNIDCMELGKCDTLREIWYEMRELRASKRYSYNFTGIFSG